MSLRPACRRLQAMRFMACLRLPHVNEGGDCRSLRRRGIAEIEDHCDLAAARDQARSLLQMTGNGLPAGGDHGCVRDAVRHVPKSRQDHLASFPH